MAEENRVRIHNRLFFKLYLNYAVMLLVTAVMIGLIFVNLYKNFNMKNYTQQLKEQAENISDDMTNEFIITKNYDDFFSYYDIIENLGLDIWTISKPNAVSPMDERMQTTSFDEISNSYVYSKMVNGAFNGEPTNYNSNDIYEVPMIMVAVPVYGENLEIVGAVMLMSELKGQDDLVYDSLKLIIASSIVALSISFVILILFAKKLSVPISRMRVTALELAAGKFNSKTNIDRKDEIGDLAKTIDILSEKLLENDIQRKNLDQMRLDFFANVSHELRTPITVVRAYTETLMDGVVTDPEKVTQYYERMFSECKSMERLVGDLLILSKMQNPDFLIEKEPVNIVQVFEDIIRSANVIAEKKLIKIEVMKDDPVYMMLGDYDRLRQMFLVILDNAIKFSEANKSIHINIKKTDRIIISIRDEGIGIDPSEIPNIFDKFYKSSLRQNANGSGLGLAIAKQIALKHDGTIEVKSEPGIGTEFVFTFLVQEEFSSIFQ
ncbi:MAG: hypothetical protein K0S47_2367 [Herbinix sp.]|jgi:signal transduction histidine kinase|nr:hypothetical protein [Herbinix sp.]